MRFMVIVKATEDEREGRAAQHGRCSPAMGAYNEELVKAGVMLDGDGLRPSSQGRPRPVRRGRQRHRHRRPVHRDQGAGRRASGSSRCPPARRPSSGPRRRRSAAASSRSGRSPPPRTSATRSPPSCASRRTGCARPPGPAARRVTRPPCPDGVDDRDLHRVVDAVWRMESAQLIGALTRVTGDVGLAEELAQDALVAALERWPETGVPAKPGAWLMATAKHRAIDTFRRAERLRAQDRAARPGARPRPRSPTGRPRSTRWSRTTCCGWSSSPATRCSPARPGWR